MTKLAEIVEKEGRGSLPRENQGLPTLDLMEMQGVAVPVDYEITGLLGDILMCELIDENDKGEVLRNGIWMKQDIVSKMWRVAKVEMCGPQCSGYIKVGDYVMYPSDRGLPMIRHHKKYVFLNEQRIFCVCKPLDK